MIERLMDEATLPVGSIGTKSNGWWAMVFVILTEGALFAYLLFAYYYLAIQPQVNWPPGGTPSMHLALPNTLILLASSVAAWWGERAILRGQRGALALGLAAALILGAVFVGIQLKEWYDKPYGIASSSYSSLYFTITGFHMAHVVVGLLMLAALLDWTLLGLFDRVRNAPVSIGAVYWHFVDAVWLVVFFTFYITPLLGLRHG
jgi:heme/copper-type cytochrome/quinol oxidase subunit 3